MTNLKEKGKEMRPPDSSAKKGEKWAWTAQAVKLLLKYIKECKSREFNGIDFEADLSSMYAKVRGAWLLIFQMISGLYSAKIQGRT